MRAIRIGAALATVLACFAGAAGAAQPPERVNFQGVLRAPGGAPVDGSRVVSFRLFDTATGCPGGGTLLLNEDYGSVPFTSGVFDVVIGGGTISAGAASGVARALLDHPEVWVEMVVGGETLCPRIRMESAAYAQLAGGLRTEGDVAIGAAEPVRPLTVSTDGGGGAISLLTGSTAGNGWGVGTSGSGLRLAEEGGAGELTLADGGGVGVGTTPAALVDVPGLIRATGGFAFPDNTLQLTELDVDHTHSGAQVDAGTIAEPRIDDVIARDVELPPGVVAVLAGQSCPTGRAVTGFAGGRLLCTDRGCAENEIECDGACVDPSTDGDHCGSCGTVCGGSSVCRTGLCESFPYESDDIATLEIVGVMSDEVLVVAGPAIDIERVTGSPWDESGPALERDFVFEYSGPAEAALEAARDDYLANNTTPTASLIVRDLGGAEVYRWTLNFFGIESIEPGLGGRNRYTMAQFYSADNINDFGDGLNFSTSRTLESCDPDRDRGVEIMGVLANRHATVVEDFSVGTLTMTFDYAEGGGIYDWVNAIVTNGTAVEGRTSVAVIRYDPPCSGTELSRVNYFEAFPIAYEHFTGFGQAIKGKERVVIAFGAKDLCTVDSQCSNDLFCDGAETCDTGPGTCDPGTDPCSGAPCDELAGCVSDVGDCGSGTEREVAPGDLVAGEIAPACDRDGYRFQVTTPTQINIVGSGGDLSFALRDADCGRLACDDDTASGGQSPYHPALSGCLAPGDYVLTARGFQSSTFQYEIDFGVVGSCDPSVDAPVIGDEAFTCLDFETCP